MTAMEEPGLDLHDWETRWQSLQDDAADDPVQSLPELVRLLDDMLAERGFQTDEPVTAEGEEGDIVRQLASARELARVVERGDPVEVTDVIEELDGLRELHDFLAENRAAP
jgi:hypothetical protein